MMKNLTTEQKNKILGFIILVLIVGGIFYSKFRNTEVKDVPPEEQKIEDPLNVLKDGEVETSPEVKATTPVSGSKTLSLQEKFSLALANGSKSYLAKDYERAIRYYYEALSYVNNDIPYSRLFQVYSAQNDIDNARVAIENAIKLNPKYTEHWISKLYFLDDKTSVSYQDLKRVYEEALTKVDYRTKLNLITSFARIAENNQQKSDAISLWEQAIANYPNNTAIYQAEIDRLKTQ